MKAYPFFVIVAILFTCLGCSKKADDNTVTPTQPDTEATQHTNTSSDEGFASSELDDLNGAVEAFLSQEGTRILRTSGPPVGTDWRCGTGITVDSSLIAQKVYKLNFTNNNCNGRTRNGTLTLSLIKGNKWSDQGSVLRLSYSNFTIVRPIDIDNRTVSISGYQDITNTTGGALYLISANQTVKHKVHAKLSININNTGERNWRIWRTRTYTKSGQDFIVSIAADTNIGPKRNIELVGSNRYEYPFTSSITSPIVSRSNCGFWKPTSGVKVHEISLKNITITYGLTTSGTATPAGQCATHYQIKSGNLNNNTFDLLVAY